MIDTAFELYFWRDFEHGDHPCLRILTLYCLVSLWYGAVWLKRLMYEFCKLGWPSICGGGACISHTACVCIDCCLLSQDLVRATWRVWALIIHVCWIEVRCRISDGALYLRYLRSGRRCRYIRRFNSPSNAQWLCMQPVLANKSVGRLFISLRYVTPGRIGLCGSLWVGNIYRARRKEGWTCSTTCNLILWMEFVSC